jgi:hypothetical protein
MNSINSTESNIRTATGLTLSAGSVGLPYATEASVTQLGKQGNTLKSYTFVGMFPVDLSPIDLDWGSNDAIEEFTVTFAYQYWNTNTTT